MTCGMPFKVLLVEGSAVLRQVICRILQMPGLPETSCLVAENSEAAEPLLSAHAVDLIILDTNALASEPGSLLQHAGRTQKLPTPPCIVISADATAIRVQQMFDLGATAYLPKPFAPAALRFEIERSLRAAPISN